MRKQKRVSDRERVAAGLHGNEDGERDTEESDVDMGPEYERRRTVAPSRDRSSSSEGPTVDRSHNGSYENPDVDSIMRSEAANHSADNGPTNQDGHRSDLKVVVSGSGAHWKICDNSTQANCDNVSVPEIQVTDTSREGRKQQCPILRHISKQQKFDHGGSADSPSQEDNEMIQKLFDRAVESIRTEPGAEKPPPRPASSPTPVTKLNHAADKRDSKKRKPSATKKQDSVTSHTSETSEISLDSFLDGANHGIPSLFKNYLTDMKTQPAEPPPAQGGSDGAAGQRAMSVFETGKAGLFLKVGGLVKA